MTPAMIVQTNRPFDAVLGDDAGDDHDERAGRPADLRLEPPRAEIRNPATTAQYSPACGGTPDEMANAIASGRATRPTVRPAIRSATNVRRS